MFMTFTFRPANSSPLMLAEYVRLFQGCFPNAAHLDEGYLHWLYEANPVGQVIGMDAFFGDRLVAHYACIPTEIELSGYPVRAMLSLNTATHPDFQGKGLFTQLADNTYQLGHSLGVTVVFGVANANSTPGFVRKLGFQLVRQLDACVGLGAPVRIDWSRVPSMSQFRRLWSPAQLKWRAQSPANALVISTGAGGIATISAKTDHTGFRAWGQLPLPEPVTVGMTPVLPAFNLFLGLLPEGTYRQGLSRRVPDRLRPSPLNLIFRHLGDASTTLDPGNVCFGFCDFDAY